MALINCLECATQISERAISCPSCGCPISRQNPTAAGTASHVSAVPVASAAKTSRMYIVLGLLIAIPLAFVGGVYIRNKAVGPVGWAQDNTVKALKAKMKDPDSMVIRSSFVIRKYFDKQNYEISICGIVDSKNSFGGYTGGTPFVSTSSSSESLGTFSTISVEMEDAQLKELANRVKQLSGFEAAYWNAQCVDSAHPPLTAGK
jgi:hypothetical protein